jgi:acetyl esterase
MMLAPEVKALLEFMNSQPQLPMADVTPALMREGAKAVAGKVEPVYQVVNTLIPIAARDNEPGRNDPLRARIYYPESTGANDAALSPAVLFFHGGGFVMCDLDSHDGMCRLLCNASKAVVISVDYRLAPEAQFPAAPEDAYRALLWLHQEAETLGIDVNAISVCGDSAGANLAAVLCLLARDRQGPLIQRQLLMYPVISPSCDTGSQHKFAKGYFLTREQMQWFWKNYLGTKANTNTPYVDLLGAEIANLPPAVIITAEYDPLCDEGRFYAEKLKAMGNAVEYCCVPGQIHGFCSFSDYIPQGREVLYSLFKS